MTRDELVNIIEEYTFIDSGYTQDNCGDDKEYTFVNGANDAANAILAKLELEQKIALSGDTIELLTLLGVAL